MTTDIKVGELTTYSVSEDGEFVVLRLTDHAGKPASLTFAIRDLGMLAMTLPSLIEAALRRKHHDASLRYTHPMGHWSIEQANNPAELIMTMKTSDGFGVSFSLPRASARQIGAALSEEAPRTVAPMLN